MTDSIDANENLDVAIDVDPRVEAARRAGLWRRYRPFDPMPDGRMWCDACMRPVTVNGDRCGDCGQTEDQIREQALGFEKPNLEAFDKPAGV